MGVEAPVRATFSDGGVGSTWVRGLVPRGGWYSKMTSKPYQNSLVNGSAFESSISGRQRVWVALDLGPPDATLPKPVSGSTSPRKVVIASQGSGYLCEVTSKLRRSVSCIFYT
jgi:hypothetical protein